MTFGIQQMVLTGLKPQVVLGGLQEIHIGQLFLTIKCGLWVEVEVHQTVTQATKMFGILQMDQIGLEQQIVCLLRVVVG